MYLVNQSALGAGGLDAATLPGEQPAPASRFYPRFIDLLLVLPFVLFFFVQLAHHQMWRDETNPWALAVRSRTLGELFYFARNEAHPYLWHLLLWIVSRATVSLIALKCVAAVVGAMNYLLLALSSPFSKLEKILFFCSYYVSFEYAVFARMYGLMLLLVFLYLRSRTSQPQNIARNGLWLGVLANADTFGLLLSFALWLEYGWFLRGNSLPLKLRRKRVVSAIAIYAVLLALSFASLIPTRHVTVKDRNGGVLAHVRERIYLSQAVRETALDSWYPVGPDAPAFYWNVYRSRHLTDGFLALVALAAALQFRREKRLIIMLAFYAAVLILFMDAVYMGSSRHYGTMFVAFVAALWIQRSEDRKRSGSPPPSPYFALVPAPLALVPLGVCAWAGVVAAYASSTHPFSQAGAAAHWLRVNHYDRAPLAGTPDYSAVNVAQHLDRPMYFLECECTDTFIQLSDNRDNFTEREIPVRLARAVREIPQPFLIFVGIRPLTPDELRALAGFSIQARLLAQFTGAEEARENFFLYKVNATPAGTSPLLSRDLVP